VREIEIETEVEKDFKLEIEYGIETLVGITIGIERTIKIYRDRDMREIEGKLRRYRPRKVERKINNTF
jgi:hypothetical protein